MKAFVLVSALTLISSLPAMGQGTNYNYNYGTSRVVNQNQTGLYHADSTYIGPGTMSQTARGLPPGGSSSMSNPMLPRVNMGANIRTPGDAMYQGGTIKYQQAPVTYQGGGGNPGLPVSKLGANIGTPGDAMRSDLSRPQQPQPRYYYRNTQPVQPQGKGIFYKTNSGGVATYAEHTANDGARRF